MLRLAAGVVVAPLKAPDFARRAGRARPRLAASQHPVQAASLASPCPSSRCPSLCPSPFPLNQPACSEKQRSAAVAAPPASARFASVSANVSSPDSDTSMPLTAYGISTSLEPLALLVMV